MLKMGTLYCKFFGKIEFFDYLCISFSAIGELWKRLNIN